MRHVIMLAGAAVCGLLAFMLNAVYLSVKTTPTAYVGVKELIEAGEPISEEKLQKVEIFGEVESTAIPYSDKETLFGRPAPRALQVGELMLWQDVAIKSPEMQLKPNETALHLSVESLQLEPSLLNVGDRIGFVVPKYPLEAEPGEKPPVAVRLEYRQIGPFRLLSVDRKIVQAPPSAEQEQDSTTRIGTISVATELVDERNFNEDANALIQARAREEISAITLNGRVLESKDVAKK